MRSYFVTTFLNPSYHILSTIIYINENNPHEYWHKFFSYSWFTHLGVEPKPKMASLERVRHLGVGIKMVATTVFRCSFHSSCVHRKTKLNNLKGKSTSSQEWLKRQLNDPYVKRAKTENYRCRSAFKLIEIDDKYHLLQPGLAVIDCGASPGSWTQVAVERVCYDASKNGRRRSQAYSQLGNFKVWSAYPSHTNEYLSSISTFQNSSFTASFTTSGKILWNLLIKQVFNPVSAESIRCIRLIKFVQSMTTMFLLWIHFWSTSTTLFS